MEVDENAPLDVVDVDKRNGLDVALKGLLIDDDAVSRRQHGPHIELLELFAGKFGILGRQLFVDLVPMCLAVDCQQLGTVGLGHLALKDCHRDRAGVVVFRVVRFAVAVVLVKLVLLLLGRQLH